MACEPLFNRVSDQFILKACQKNTKVAEVELIYPQTGKTYDNLKSIIPTFNHDKLYFTPAFLLPTDQKYFLSNQTFQRYQFNQKVERALEAQSQTKPHKNIETLMVASPSTKYCQVCQQQYENYFQHVSLESHKQTAKNNPINNAILQLCEMVQAKKIKQKQPKKSRYIKKRFRKQTNEETPQTTAEKEEAFEDFESASYSKSIYQSTIYSQK